MLLLYLYKPRKTLKQCQKHVLYTRVFEATKIILDKRFIENQMFRTNNNDDGELFPARTTRVTFRTKKYIFHYNRYGKFVIGKRIARTS